MEPLNGALEKDKNKKNTGKSCANEAVGTDKNHIFLEHMMENNLFKKSHHM